jgi:hypothetical protein
MAECKDYHSRRRLHRAWRDCRPMLINENIVGRVPPTRARSIRRRAWNKLRPGGPRAKETDHELAEELARNL